MLRLRGIVRVLKLPDSQPLITLAQTRIPLKTDCLCSDTRVIFIVLTYALYAGELLLHAVFTVMV